MRLRTNYRVGEDVYLYRAQMTPEQGRRFFLDYLHRVMQDWYLFAEVRMEMGDRAGNELAFNAADFFVPARNNQIIVQTGHGTDLA